MNKEIRAAIIQKLKINSEAQVGQTYLEQLAQDPAIVVKELRLMQDEGLVEIMDMRPEHWRLTSLGAQIDAPLLDKIMNYFATHWLAIAALVISIIALLKR